MNINTLTVKAQEALQSALTLARERGQQAVEPLHILSVLVREDDSLAAFLLGRVGVNVRGLRDEADRAVASLPRVEGGGDQFFSQDSSKVIQRAVDFTRNFGDKYASVEHLLLGLIAERGQAADILKRSGATEKELLEAIRTFRKGATVDSQTSEQQFDALGKYAINLNEQARSGKLDPVIGRDEEIRRVCHYVNADHFIDKLDHGLDEEVRERGNNFSAGQRQLLSFARTIIHKPSVMILDEATANIDTETELLIQDSLEKMRSVGTMLMVAHRLSTIQHADNIIVLSHGKILEQGTHQELLAKHGRYYQLYTLQYHKEQMGE